MPYRICKSFEIENGHMLSKHPDNCKFPHGHSRKVEFVLEAKELDQNDMVCDFKVLKDAIKDFIMSFDHSMCMNTEDSNYQAMKKSFGERVIGFPGQDPTTEVMAKVIYDEANKRLSAYSAKEDTRYPLSDAVRIIRVRLWETSSSWAEFIA